MLRSFSGKGIGITLSLSSQSAALSMCAGVDTGSHLPMIQELKLIWITPEDGYGLTVFWNGRSSAVEHRRDSRRRCGYSGRGGDDRNRRRGGEEERHAPAITSTVCDELRFIVAGSETFNI